MMGNLYDDMKNADWLVIHDNLSAIQDRVAERTGLARGWIARQQTIGIPRQWIGATLVVGAGACFIPNEELMHSPDDPVFIDMLAEQILGYPPDSPEHYHERLFKLDTEIKNIENQIGVIQSRLYAVRAKRAELLWAFNKAYPNEGHSKR